MPLLDDLTNGLQNIYGNGGVGDPLISIGMGLLSRRGVGQGLAQGFQNVAATSQLAEQKKRQELQDKLLTAQTAKAMRPSYQYHTDPNTGVVSAIDPTNPNAGLMPLPNQQPSQAVHWAAPNELPQDYKGPTPQIDAKGLAHYPPAAGATVNMPPTEKAFDKSAGENIAKRFAGLSDEGDTAQQDLAMLSRLRGLGGNFDSGFWGNARGVLAEHGIKLGDNVGSIEAYKSLIDKLTPQQRVPGSGASSNLDVTMMKRALPSAINTPEGNNMILDTLEGMANYKLQRAAIADRAQAGEISHKDAIAALRALPNPMEKFNKQFSVETQPSGAPAAPAPAPQQKTGKMSPAPSGELEKAREIIRLNPALKPKVLNHFLQNGYDPAGL